MSDPEKIKVVCPKCNGKGTILVYVGCDCTRLTPYDTETCPMCDGKRSIMATPVKEATT